jgi:peptide chain release factor 2
VELWDGTAKRLEDAQVLMQLAAEEGDASVLDEVGRELEVAAAKVGEMEFARMLGGKADPNPAILSINAGQGGNDANEWAAMLLRMYLRYCERRGYAVEVIDQQDGDEAGLKSATFVARGPYAYGYLKAESGVHRLVRISPFSGRRETSFASVLCIPEIDDDIDVKVDEKDLRIDTYRSSGAGGQHVNKTDSAVRLTHLPTGIVVACQNERSQHKNKAMAFKILRARLYEFEREKREKEMQQFQSSVNKAAGFGSQDRNYVLAPYRLVKDLRTGVETGNVDAVLDGQIDQFIHAFLMQGADGAPGAAAGAPGGGGTGAGPGAGANAAGGKT